jgi:putative salt-induced outer membrane protein
MGAQMICCFAGHGMIMKKNQAGTLMLMLSTAAVNCLAADGKLPEAPPPKTAFVSSIAAGLTLTKGNSDTVVGTLNYLSEKKWDENELRFGADASYGETDDVKNNESLHGFGQFNRLVTPRFYGYARLDGLHDAIADVEYRFTFGPGAGYYLIKNDTTLLSVEGGPSIVTEKQGPDERTYFTVRIAERLEHKFNDRFRVWQSIEFLPQVDRFGNFIVNGEVGVETDLTKTFSLRVFALDTYDNEPAPGRKKNDVKLVTAVAYKF